MTPEAEELLARVLALPVDVRALFIDHLHVSLDDDGGELSPEWQAEIQRRIAESDAGIGRWVSWEEARRRILEP